MEIDIQLVDARLLKPEYFPRAATEGSAGYDLRACIANPVELRPGDCILIPTGLAIHMEDTGMMAALLPRSGLGFKEGIVLGNLVGVIDSDYTDQIYVPAWNRRKAEQGSYFVQPMSKIAQLVFLPVLHPQFRICTRLGKTTRTGGFGHTGLQ